MTRAAEGGAVRRVVLLGMMGAGKTAVGGELARRLGWRHVDLDRRIEAAEGRSVAELFAAEGEPRFRELEALHTAALAGEAGIVLSPGGGWITRPALLASLGAGTLSCWLRVAPEEAARRVRDAPGERPLLATADPLAALRELLRAREPLYARADLALETTGSTVPEIAERILDELRARGAAPGATLD